MGLREKRLAKPHLAVLARCPRLRLEGPWDESALGAVYAVTLQSLSPEHLPLCQQRRMTEGGRGLPGCAFFLLGRDERSFPCPEDHL